MAKKRAKRKIATIDCETDPFKEGRIPAPFIWGFYSLEHGQLFFYKIAEMMEFISTLDGYIIYAHNGGKFDFHFMLEYIQDWQRITLINNRLVAWKFSSSEFRDSYALIPAPLKSYNKKEIDYNLLETGEREKPENAALIADYLAHDCLYLFELVTGFIELYGLHLTAASAAIKTLMKIENIKIPNSGREFFDKLSPYYYGGRVQCFKKGILDGDFSVYDINSAYPAAMLSDHPIGACFIGHDTRPNIDGHNFYTLECVSAGALPFRADDKTLQFPDDGKKRVYHVTGWEYIEAQKLGLLSEVVHIKQMYFPETMNFKNFVHHFYAIKNSAPEGSPEKLGSKIMLNSAYGKYCSAAHRYRTFRLVKKRDFMKIIERGWMIHGEIHDRLIVSSENEQDRQRFYNIATGASITGHVRAFLLKSLNSVDKPLYCDTDSIAFSGKHALIVGKELGQWKHEGDFIEGGIGGKKLYAFKDKNGKTKTASKGLRINYDEIMHVCKGNKIERTPDAPIFSIKRGKYFLKKTVAMT